MTKVYFDSKEEAWDFWASMNHVSTSCEEAVGVMNRKGYIKKSDLEIAREKYIEYYNNEKCITSEVLVKADIYIKQLEKALEEIKK